MSRDRAQEPVDPNKVREIERQREEQQRREEERRKEEQEKSKLRGVVEMPCACFAPICGLLHRPHGTQVHDTRVCRLSELWRCSWPKFKIRCQRIPR